MSFLPSFLLQLLFLSQTSLAFHVHNNNASSFQKCPHDQKSALLQLKHGFSIYRFDDDSSSKLDSWNPDTDCCSWAGITCDGATSHVIEIDLNRIPYNGNSIIEGRIDSSLFRLGSLQRLNLAYNDFNLTSIPSGLGQLSNLTHLNLSHSSFAGQIPLEISQLTKLVSLDLSTNDYYGGSKYQLKLKNPNLATLVGNVSSLRELFLDGVNMSSSSKEEEHNGEWAQVLSTALPNLRRLSLRYCGLTGPIDPSVFKLPFLSQLSLDGNNLSSIMEANFLGDSSSLTTLSLSGCGLYGKFPESIFLRTNLQTLDISYNPLLTVKLPRFPESSAFQRLILDSTRVDDKDKLPDSISNLKFLKELSLRNCNISGSFPSWLANFTLLENLDLSSNNLSGTIPSSFGDELQHLSYLDLYDNSLEGTIPSSFFSHPSLQYLDLHRNQFTSCIDDFHNNASSSLRGIYLSGNKLQGPIPRSFFKLVELQSLDLSFNNFSGTIELLDMFQSLKNLSFLSLSNNNLSIINGNGSSHLVSSSQIYYLGLSSCNICEFPNILQSLPQLRYLDLSNNKIHGEIPNWIWKVGNGTMYSLNLSHNFLESRERPLPDLSFLSNLDTVDLHFNMLQGSLPTLSSQVSFQDYSNNNFTSMPTNTTFGRFFFLSSNNVSGEIPLSICNASYLEVLDLSNNNFSGNIPKCLDEVSNSLKILNLKKNSFQGVLPQTFRKECVLRTLNLHGNQLEGLLPTSLANCNMLEVFDIGNNRINDTFPFWLQNQSHLRILILHSNKFHGPIAHSHTDNLLFPVLQIFDLSSNSFTGILPTNLFVNWKGMIEKDDSHLNSGGQIVRYQLRSGSGGYYQDSVTVTMKGLEMEVVKILTALTLVDLSNNGFEGDIPNSIGNLTLLYLLNFSQNDFSGPIPTSLENLMQLESLDLSQNKLSGEIPWQLSKLTFLAVLNFSQNLLVGSIPQSRQFLTFSNGSFLGNIGLCGSPLSKKCEDAKDTLPSSLQGGGGKIDREMWIGFGVGYGVGFGVVFWILALWKTGCRKFMQLVDGMFLRAFPMKERIAKQRKGKQLQRKCRRR